MLQVSSPPALAPDPTPTGTEVRRLRRAWPYLVPAVVLSVVYGLTVQRSTGNAFSLDTTKFEYVGRVLGTPHPPGYPLYTLLNAGFVRLVPLGGDALRANLLSAVLALATCVVAVRVLRELGLRRRLAAGGATALGLLPALWRNAVVAEVYSFTALFVVAVLACVLSYERTRRPAWLRAALLVFALSFAHVTSQVLFAPGLVLYVVLRRPRWLFRLRELGVLLPTGALLAFLPYAYVPWRTAVAGNSWVETRVYDAHSMWAALSGAQFGDRMFEVPLGVVASDRLPVLGAGAVDQLGPLLPLCALGLLVLAVERPLVAVLTLAWAGATAGFVLTYLVGDWPTLLLPVWLLVALWALVGLDRCVTAAGRRAAAVATVLALTLPLVALVSGYAGADRRGPDPQQAVDAAVAAVPDGALVFTPSLEARQQFVYRLLPGGLGLRRSVYAAEGPNYTDLPGQAVFEIRDYCRPEPGPWPWPWHEQLAAPTVPRGLRTFVFGRAYAAQVAADGLPVRHVQGELYAVGCGSPAAPDDGKPSRTHPAR